MIDFMPDKELPQDIIIFKNHLLGGLDFDFTNVALTMFDWQSKQNPVYKEYLKLLKFDLKNPGLDQIPHLPITSFKNFTIKTGNWESQTIFHSSSTTGKGRSAHHIRDMAWYEAVSQLIFENHFNSCHNKVILALLPGYLEREDSSLVHMVKHLMNISGHSQNGFYLNNYEALAKVISDCKDDEIILFGIPYGFMNCLEIIGDHQWSNVTIIETGGMKGKGPEIPRIELHKILDLSFSPKYIYSEYGMTELLSQAYTDHNGFFKESKTLHIRVNELNDPFQFQKKEKPGALNIIDLANIDTCCFIETEDMAVDQGNGSFEILGRIDNREIRGCNLLA